MKIAAVLVLSFLLGACASAPVTAPRADLLDDTAFAAPSERVSTADIFALSPEMRQFIATRIEPVARTGGAREALLSALYEHERLKLEYDAEMTRNAAQAFAARSGNCLSLVIMTAAFAKALDIPVRYQNVLVEETWSRDGNIYFSIGHVNLTLIAHTRIGMGRADGESTIDFLPPRDIRKQRTRVISEETVVAMYLNNRAVEAMARGQLDDAYWWAREAVLRDPAFVSSYNTLGAIYERRGRPARAEKAFAYVLEREPRNTRAIANLVGALNAQGRATEANAWSRVAQELDPNPPFSYFKRGLAAMQAQDYKSARELFAKEIARAPDYHEFHYWLGAAYVGLGEYEQARKELTIAMDTSTTRRDHDLYAAKYAWIASHSR
jgi:tetratricopeptide (TPR) repeat protein